MEIRFDEKSKTFFLKAEKFTYIFYVNHLNILTKLYFGEPIEIGEINNNLLNFINNLNADSYNYFDLKTQKEVINQDPYFSGLTSEIEAPSFLTYDKRGALVEIRHSDNSSLTDFRYVSHKIYTGKEDLDDLPHFNDKDALTLELLLKDIKDEIYLKMFYTLYEGENILVRHNEIINKSKNEVKILRANSLALDLPTLDYDLLSVYGTYATDRILEREELKHNITSITENAGGKGFYHNPMCMLLKKDTTYDNGEIIGIGLVYSGNFKFDFIGNPLNKLRCLIGINDENFEYPLKTNETFVTPEAFISYSKKGINSMSHIFHNAIKNHLLRKVDGFNKTILLNSWEGCMMDFNTQKIIKFIDKAKEMGVNLFVLDDGWFAKRNSDDSSLGDWYVNKDKIDVKKVVDYAHSKNIKFGIWIEPEMISFDSELYRAHPEYALYDRTVNPTVLRHQFVLDITKKEVRDYIFNQIKTLFEEYHFDYCKWDFNRLLTETVSQMEPSKSSYLYHAFTLGSYDLLNRFMKTFPNVLLETCAGGGGRFDLGMLYYSSQIWGSDETDGVARTLIQFATNVFYPLKVIGSHVSARKFLSIKEKAAVALFGTFGYELDPTKLSDEELKEVKISNEWFDKYKDLIDEGDYYSLISPYGNNFVAWEVVKKDQSEALIFFMNYRQVNRESRFLKVHGLKKDAYYQNDLTNDVFKGDIYSKIGLNLSSGRQSFTPSLIHLKEVSDEKER